MNDFTMLRLFLEHLIGLKIKSYFSVLYSILKKLQPYFNTFLNYSSLWHVSALNQMRRTTLK